MNYRLLLNEWLKKYLEKNFQENQGKYKEEQKKTDQLINHSIKIYEKGYSGLDILKLLENEGLEKKGVFQNITADRINELSFHFQRIKKEFRNEKIILFFFLHFIFLSSECSLENISFI